MTGNKHDAACTDDAMRLKGFQNSMGLTCQAMGRNLPSMIVLPRLRCAGRNRSKEDMQGDFSQSGHDGMEAGRWDADFLRGFLKASVA